MGRRIFVVKNKRTSRRRRVFGVKRKGNFEKKTGETGGETEGEDRRGVRRGEIEKITGRKKKGLCTGKKKKPQQHCNTTENGHQHHH